jgi:tRNA (guanine37-N1)-methyltransferase
MRIDVVSIFPAYLAPLDLSLPGKAQESGLLDLRVHDLRKWTHDAHRTVDDSPYGGGAGMVMKPDPWGDALDEIVVPADGQPVLVIPTPSGLPFTQAVAAELAAEDWLVIACGRYEGIDERVVDHARKRMEVREVSVGDYVLNGGEVAALVITEAVVRLLPGFMGNASSLAEESHGADGLLEYPVYTKPAEWRGLAVPEVLFSGDHARIAAWRHEQSLWRTSERRPDLLPATATLGLGDDVVTPVLATRADAAELWTLQRACWVAEAQANDTLEIPPLTENLDGVVSGIADWRTYVVRANGRLVASVRGRFEGETWHVGRLMVAPDLQGRGLGRFLLEFIESLAPEPVRRFELFTGSQSVDNLRMYKKAGYRPARQQPEDPGVRRLEKRHR